ncbi:hypothetical protein [Paludisphaera soli]|uniref:hypothetical protein n=1 Tax=Paludisphaera soli TaxID=2712865 RepID=UPI0013E9B369|nr:hypothetical protein [Paludisphaera soli]
MTPDLETLLDRLVDGDLAPAELREALTAVEAAPDGWRRCALALLEARCLDHALREPAPAPKPTFAVAAPSRRRFRPALAASLALACFGSGWLVGGGGPGPVDEPEPPAPLVARAEPSPESPEPPPEAPQPQPEAPQPPPAPVRLASWVVNQPLPVSDAERAALEARGYRLDQQRRLVSARLADGRRVVVPVDRLGLRYVGGATL